MRNKSLLLLPVLASMAIHAQDKTTQSEELQELVIQQNRLQIPFDESTKNVEIITKKDIEKMPATSINEVLAFVSGVDVRQRGPFGTQMDVSIDGGSFEQTMILWNGVKVGDAQTAHNSMNLPIPLDAVERIEVLRGPAARIYGINALTGAINIVTKPSYKNDISVRTYAGSSFKDQDKREGDGIYSGGGVQALANFKTCKVNHLASFQKEKYNGQRYNSASDNVKAFYQGVYDLDTNNQIEWLAGYVNSDFGANGFYAAGWDEDATEEVKTLISSVGATIQLTDNLYIKPRISNRYNEDEYLNLPKNNFRNKHYLNTLMFELNGIYSTSVGDFGFGYESRVDDINSNKLGKDNRTNQGVYAEYKNSFDKWLINLGAYVNHNSDYGTQVYPGLDVSYRLTQDWKLNASIGRSNRIPSFTDLYYKSPSNIGNPNLKPESAMQYEGGIDYYKSDKRFRVSAFQRKITDFIDWVKFEEDNPFSPENFGNQSTRGISLLWNQLFNISEKQLFRYKLSYQYLSPITDTERKVQSKYVLESLQHQAILGLQYNYNSLGLHLQNRYIKRELNDAYLVTDAKINLQANKNIGIYAQMSNIFDAEYIEVGAVPLPTQWFQLGLQFNLNK